MNRKLYVVIEDSCTMNSRAYGPMLYDQAKAIYDQAAKEHAEDRYYPAEAKWGLLLLPLLHADEAPPDNYVTANWLYETFSPY